MNIINKFSFGNKLSQLYSLVTYGNSQRKDKGFGGEGMNFFITITTLIIILCSCTATVHIATVNIATVNIATVHCTT